MYAYAPEWFGAALIEGGRVSDFVEKPQGDGGQINAGFFVCNPSVLDYIDGDTCVWEESPLRTLANNDQLSAFVHDGFWKPMDTLREKTELEELWQSGKARWKVWSD